MAPIIFEIQIFARDVVYTLPDYKLPPETVLQVKCAPGNIGFIFLKADKEYTMVAGASHRLHVSNTNEVSVRGLVIGDRFMGIVEASVNIELYEALYEALKEADEVICTLCKRLNPQHVSMDYGKGCDWCDERDARLKLLTEVGGKK